MRNRWLGSVVVCLGVATMSQATVLTFADLNLTNYGDIPQTYGDAVSSTGSSPNGTYLMGNGWTPNIQTSYRSVDGNGVQIDGQLDYWDYNYGDLVDVAFSPTFGLYSQITLTPDAGYSVTLNSFDLGSYYLFDRNADRIRVYDSNGLVWNMDNTTALGANGTHSSYTPNITSSGPLTIEWGSDWNIGIDNVNFDQTSAPVPEPMTIGLVACALAAAWRKRIG